MTKRITRQACLASGAVPEGLIGRVPAKGFQLSRLLDLQLYPADQYRIATYLGDPTPKTLLAHSSWGCRLALEVTKDPDQRLMAGLEALERFQRGEVDQDTLLNQAWPLLMDREPKSLKSCIYQAMEAAPYGIRPDRAYTIGQLVCWTCWERAIQAGKDHQEAGKASQEALRAQQIDDLLARILAQ